MLQIYEKKITTYWRGEKQYSSRSISFIDEEQNFEPYEVEFTWDNLTELYQKYAMVLPFNIWHFKKGRAVCLFDPSFFDKKTWDIKEWKEKNLDIKLSVEIEKSKFSYSISDIMKDFPSDIAIKYLVERGLSIINK